MKKIVTYLIISLILIPGCKQFNSKTGFTNGIDTIISTSSNDRIEDSITIEKLKLVKAEQAYTIDSLKSLLKENKVYTENRFYIITGSFQNRTYADKYAQKISELGYDTQIITGRSNFNMVTARGYNNFRLAINEIDYFRENVSEKAWVYIIK